MEIRECNRGEEYADCLHRNISQCLWKMMVMMIHVAVVFAFIILVVDHKSEDNMCLRLFSILN